MFEKETEKLQASFDLYEESDEEEGEMSNDDDDDSDGLEEAYISIYTESRSTARKCESFDKLKAIRDELQLSYHERKQELERLTKQLDVIEEDPKVKELRT